MKKLCECLKMQTMRIINVKKKKNEIINKRTAEIISMQKFAIFVEKCLKKNM